MTNENRKQRIAYLSLLAPAILLSTYGLGTPGATASDDEPVHEGHLNDDLNQVELESLLGKDKASEGENQTDEEDSTDDSSNETEELFPGITASEAWEKSPRYVTDRCIEQSGNTVEECIEIAADATPCTAVVRDVESHDPIGHLVDSCIKSFPELTSDEKIKQEAVSAFMQMNIEPATVKFEESLLGFGYKDQHTHIYADVQDETSTQEMLGSPVDVRAVPVSYKWHYGDRTSRTTYEPGEPLPDYDGSGNEINKMDFPTETSHVYEETGIYPVTVTTKYTGQFRVDGGAWEALPGSVNVESSPGEADIWTQNSRWVSGACESRQQWGCNGPVQFDPATDRPPKIYQDQYDENGRWIGPVN